MLTVWVFPLCVSVFERGVPFDASINLSICLKNPSVLRNLSSDLGGMELKKTASKLRNIPHPKKCLI